MKTFLLQLFSIFSVQLTVQSQPFLEENFEYPAGTLTTVSANWVEEPTGNYDVQVLEGNLEYNSYPSSGKGNMIFLDGGTTGRSGVQTTFNILQGTGKIVYVSFLFSLLDTLDMTMGSFFRLKHSNVAKLYIYLQKVSGTGKFNLGLSKGAARYFCAAQLNPGEVYLITAAYEFEAGYDSLKMWINPDLSGSIPEPDLAVCPAELDATGFSQINFVQLSGTGNQYIDGIRLDTAWAQAPLPVELSLFTAELKDNTVHLRWRTETEIDNYGFEIERSTGYEYQTWSKIGFVQGYGNSNIPHEYYLLDGDIFNCSVIRYRLKQVDTDGKYTYSEVTEISTAGSGFYLYQNFPNPFNSITKIRYNIPSFDNDDNPEVIMKLYNVLGNETAVLLKKVHLPGLYELQFDTKRLALSQGVYFSTLEIFFNNKAERLCFTRKMIILK